MLQGRGPRLDVIQEHESSASPETAGSGSIEGLQSVSPSATWELRDL